MNQLRNIFGLGKREAENITLDVTVKVYRKRLSQSVSGGHLEAADSKAAFLQNLCEELHLDPLKATGIHEGNVLFIIFAHIFLVTSRSARALHVIVMTHKYIN